MRINDLIASYRTDEASAYRKLRYRTRQNYDGLLRHIERDLGAQEIADIRTRLITLQYQMWRGRGEYMSHSLVSMLRTLLSFGGTYLENDDCLTLSRRMSGMRFAMGKPRSSRITAILYAVKSWFRCTAGRPWAVACGPEWHPHHAGHGTSLGAIA